MEKMKQQFADAVRDWLTENGYIGNGWRMKVVSRTQIGRTDCAEIYCEAFKPRARKPFSMTFRYDFVRESILTDTIEVAGI